MLNVKNENQKYYMEVGYGDDSWDDGEEHFYSDSLEEMLEYAEAFIDVEVAREMLEKEGKAYDGYEMWYIYYNN